MTRCRYPGARRLITLPLKKAAMALSICLGTLATGSAAIGSQVADLCYTVSGGQAGQYEPALDGTLEILSWNIQKASNAGWAADLATLAVDIDLAFIQEASLQAGIPEIVGNPLYQAFAPGYSSGELETGVMTLSTRSPVQTCQFTSWEPLLGTPKATSITRFPLARRDDTLLAINLHAVNFALGLDELQGQLRALNDLLAMHTGPVILAGDLNTWSEERQQLVDTFAARYGLAPVAFTPDLRSRVFGRALDHIYVRGMTAMEAQAIAVTTSDHNPLRVSLVLDP